LKIAFQHSHLNGLEYLIVHRPHLWKQIQQTIASIDAEACKTKVSKEKNTMGQVFYSPIAMNAKIGAALAAHGWKQRRVSYWVTPDVNLIRQTMTMSAKDQRAAIEAAGAPIISSYNQTDFVQERVAMEVQFGKYSFVAYDMFVKHMAFYVGNEIDVGIEILPSKRLAKMMSSGVPDYEGALYDLIRNGRGVPAVPMVVLGIEQDDVKATRRPRTSRDPRA
jgi:hypothetical protein